MNAHMYMGNKILTYNNGKKFDNDMQLEGNGWGYGAHLGLHMHLERPVVGWPLLQESGDHEHQWRRGIRLSGQQRHQQGQTPARGQKTAAQTPCFSCPIRQPWALPTSRWTI